MMGTTCFSLTVCVCVCVCIYTIWSVCYCKKIKTPKITPSKSVSVLDEHLDVLLGHLGGCRVFFIITNQRDSFERLLAASRCSSSSDLSALSSILAVALAN